MDKGRNTSKNPAVPNTEMTEKEMTLTQEKEPKDIVASVALDIEDENDGPTEQDKLLAKKSSEEFDETPIAEKKGAAVSLSVSFFNFSTFNYVVVKSVIYNTSNTHHID